MMQLSSAARCRGRSRPIRWVTNHIKTVLATDSTFQFTWLYLSNTTAVCHCSDVSPSQHNRTKRSGYCIYLFDSCWSQAWNKRHCHCLAAPMDWWISTGAILCVISIVTQFNIEKYLAYLCQCRPSVSAFYVTVKITPNSLSEFDPFMTSFANSTITATTKKTLNR